MALGSSDGTLPLYLLRPPYLEFEPLPASGAASSRRLQPGTVVAISSTDPRRDWTKLEEIVPRVRARFTAAPVVLRVPPSPTVEIVHLAGRAGTLRLRAVLVDGEPAAETLRDTLTAPADLPGDVEEWLVVRGVDLSPACLRTIHRIFLLAPSCWRLAPLLGRIGEPPRTVRSRFRRDGVPAPSRWLAVAHAVRAGLRLQAERRRSSERVALDAGYCDYSALSHQTARLFGTTPAHVKHTLGWEWLLDRWLGRERIRSLQPA